MKSKNYNGWKNRATWNVALWINNDMGLYHAAVEFVERQESKKKLYKRFIYDMGLENSSTPDRVKWLSDKLAYSELNELMRNLIQ